MHRDLAAGFSWRGLGLAGVVFLAAVRQAVPQDTRQHVFLPPAVGGTPLSFQIQAQASYISAYGDMVESMAVARKINAEAVALEIQNSIDAVDAYFKRRELNREHRKLDLDLLAREKLFEDRINRSIKELPQRIVGSGSNVLVTNRLNWMLQELTGAMLAHQYLPKGQTLAYSKLDQELTPEERKLIRVTDGGGKIKTLVTGIDDGVPLKTRWPFGLMADQFKGPRTQFEAARDAFIAEARSKEEVSYETSKKLREDVVTLMVALEAAYSKEARADPNEYVTYVTSKRFLQGLWGGVQRATTTKDLSVFSGRLRFQGDSVVALMQHMYSFGLEFAPPEPGGEGVYKKLFNVMRNLDINLVTEEPATGAAKP